ncbi:MAG: hypothetical protein AB9866_18885 [Syntrophobacteraceae bacterium]
MGQLVSKDDLDLIEPVLAKTDTFHPVAHGEIARMMITLSRDILVGYELVEERYEIARDGGQAFGTLSYQKGDNGIYMAVGWRNSTDKSLAIGVCMGGSVICCSNLMFEGDIKILKKHSKGVWKAIEDLAITSFYRHNHAYDKILQDSELMRRRMLTDNDVFRWYGLLYGNQVLSPRQLTVAVKEWRQTSFDEFRDRTAWSAYNACTYALKGEAPSTVLESHSKLHSMIVDI